MHRSTTLSLLLVAALMLPVAAAGVGQQMDSSQQTADGTQQAGEQSNYTQLYVTDQYRSLELKPGESETVSVDVENGEDEPVTITPQLYTPEVGQPPVQDDWVTISDDDITLDPEETVTVDATVAIPEDAELGSYTGALAVTDETISYPGRPAIPVHSANLGVEVYREPTVTIESGSYGSTQARAGSTTTHEIVVENAGDQAVPLNPEVSVQDARRRAGGSQSLEPSWFDISAPTEIEAGETATVEVTISPPEDADRGRYDTEIDLGIQDPARQPGDEYWQQVNLNIEVWEPPTEPFEREFEVDDADQVTMTLSTYDRPRSDDGPAPSFDVTLVSPNGTEIDADRVERSTSGSVSLADRAGPTQSQDGAYSARGAQQEFVYRVEEPAAGTWSAEIMPENAIEFEYDITRTASSD